MKTATLPSVTIRPKAEGKRSNHGETRTGSPQFLTLNFKRAKRSLWQFSMLMAMFLLGLSGSALAQTQVSETFTTAGTYNWVAPTGVTSVTIECWGVAVVVEEMEAPLQWCAEVAVAALMQK